MTHLRIEQEEGTTEYVSTAIISKLYQYAKEIKDYEADPNNNFSGDSQVSLKGTLSVPKAYKDEVEWLTDADILDVSQKKFPDLHITAQALYIKFVDPEVKRVLLTKYGDGTGITREDMSSVTSLAQNLFKNNTVITSFDELGQFPSIIRIKYDCFFGATNLQSIDLSNIEELGNNAFNQCSLSGIINAPQLKTIGSQVFANNVGITEINIGSQVPDQDKITSLDTATFQNCSSLTKVTGLKKVTYIGSVAFNGTDIQYLDLETPIIGLGRECFKNCTKIRCMDLSNYVPYTGNIYGMFMGCTGLIDLSTYDTSNINTGSATYTFNWDFVPQYIFCNCTSLNKAFVFPNATSVGISSFQNTKITSLSAPNATDIGNNAFKGVTTLTSVNIPSAIEVGRECFEGCNGLTSIDLSSITSIGSSAFQNCTALTTVTLNPNFTQFTNSRVFQGCSSLTTIDLSNITKLSENCFSSCTSLGTNQTLELNLSDQESYPHSALRGTKYTRLILHSPQQTGGYDPRYPLYETMMELTYLDLSDWKPGLQSNSQWYSDASFYNNDSLVTYIAPETTNYFGYAIKRLGEFSNMRYIILLATTPPALNTTDHNNPTSTWFYVNGNVHIYVPDSAKAAYLADSDWSTIGGYNGSDTLADRLHGLSELPNGVWTTGLASQYLTPAQLATS